MAVPSLYGTQRLWRRYTLQLAGFLGSDGFSFPQHEQMGGASGVIKSELMVSGKSQVELSLSLQLACKFLLDLGAGIAGGILVLPVIGLAVLVIKLIDPGPGLYIQNRLGKNGRIFRILKLRTMRADNDAWLSRYLARNPEARDPRIYRDARDPRIMPTVGAWLRRYSIDELPQIWNVVRGDMSFVGPRPLPDYHYRLLSPEFLALRSRVLPGITGLWQIEGRSDASPSTIESYDMKYLNNWSLGADLRILLRTVVCVLRGSGV